MAKKKCSQSFVYICLQMIDCTFFLPISTAATDKKYFSRQVGNLPSTYSSRARLDIAPWGRNKKIKRVNCSIRSVRFAFKSICLMQFMNFDLTNSLFGLLRSYRLIVFATCLLRILLPGRAMGPGYSLKFTNILKYIKWKYFVKQFYFSKQINAPF